MRHIYSLTEAALDRPSIVTVGVFDGVHRGHQQLVRQLVKTAHEHNQAAVVLTFFPHPDVVIRGVKDRHYLTSPEERAHLLGELGVDLIISHPFNEEVRQIRAADFVDRLLYHLQMKALWATNDFALGYKREGNISFLREQGHQKGYTVETIDLVMIDGGKRISSSEIREVLQNGDIATANAYLNRSYRLAGEVVHGEKRGRKIGFPTANVAVWDEQVIPQFGVYVCRAFLGDEEFIAVTNVGQRPTFDGQHITVEAHLLDFARDIYGAHLTLDFEARLRGEIRFSGIEALIGQIRQDIDQARMFVFPAS